MLDIMKEEGVTKIILFKDAMNHIIRIIRVFRLTNGHIILIG